MSDFPTSLTPIVTNYSKNTKARTLTTGFGDGYRQRAGDGINNINKDISLEYNGTTTQIKVYTDFLEARGGSEVFNYTLPKESTSEKWTCEEWTASYLADSTAVLTLSMRKEFDL